MSSVFEIVSDFTDVERLLLGLTTLLYSPALTVYLDTQVDPWLRARAESRFETEGDDATGKWAQLEPTTGLIRLQQGYGAFHPINRRTGALERYITETPNRITPMSYGVSMRYPGRSPGGTELQSKVKVAQVGGYQPGRRPTPPRPVLALGEHDLEFILYSLSKYFERGPL